VSFLFAMTLPAVVVLLVVVAAVESVVVRQRRRRGDVTARSRVAAGGFDTLGVALAPTREHALEQKEHERLHREDDDEAAPPASRVDLETGRARLVVPPRGGATGA
jgi:hypothetical protein